MRLRTLVLVVLLLGGCHLLLPFGAGSGDGPRGDARLTDSTPHDASGPGDRRPPEQPPCGPGTWCKEIVEGAQPPGLMGVWGDRVDNVFAVGGNIILRRLEDGTWTREPIDQGLPPNVLLKGVSGATPTGSVAPMVSAVGRLEDHGLILGLILDRNPDTKRWQTSSPPAPAPAPLNDVVLAGDGWGLAVGDKGTTWYRTLKIPTWRVGPSFNNDLTGAGLGPGYARVVGVQMLGKLTTGESPDQSFPSGPGLNGISINYQTVFVDPLEFWCGGGTATQGTAVAGVCCDGSFTGCSRISVSTVTDIWMRGTGKAYFLFDDREVKSGQPSPPTPLSFKDEFTSSTPLHSLWGFVENDQLHLFAVGDGGTILHFQE